MIYAKLDVDITDHPRALRAGLAAFGLWSWGLAYSRKHELDGELPRASVLLALGGEGVTEAAAKLVAVGLWEESEDGWRMFKYAQKNETKADIEVRRSYDRDRKRSSRGSSERPSDPCPVDVSDRSHTNVPPPSGAGFPGSDSDSGSGVCLDPDPETPPGRKGGEIPTAEAVVALIGPDLDAWAVMAGAPRPTREHAIEFAAFLAKEQRSPPNLLAAFRWWMIRAKQFGAREGRRREGKPPNGFLQPSASSGMRPKLPPHARVSGKSPEPPHA